MADYLIGGALLLFCYVAFFQSDIYVTGWNALNYLYGNPLEFYENCKKIQGHGVLAAANYPPSIFVVFALWLYPFKLFGLIKSPFYFSPYWVYWLKALTSLVYVATGLLFYRVTQVYSQNIPKGFQDVVRRTRTNERNVYEIHEHVSTDVQQHHILKGEGYRSWGAYATWLWLTTPLAVFSQFIFSQYDIFYVFLTVAGFLAFLKKNIFFASLLFGLAITFKYFPLFVFVPLLLFFEKKIGKLFLCGVIFSIPILLIQGLYGHSSAYISGVMGFSVLGRVFSAALDISGQKIYYIFAVFSILAGISYCLDFSENYKRVAAYIFLFSSILPFLFISWHPQWLIFITPAMALTTVMNKPEKIYRLLWIDLLGMFFFIAYVFLIFQNNVDLAMFQAKLLHIPFENSRNIGSLFKLFKGFSANVYLSVFWAYLILQFILRYKSILTVSIQASEIYLYSQVRIRYYLGLLIFLVPVIFIFSINYQNRGRYVLNPVQEKTFGELISGRTFEQSFVAKESLLTQVDLLLATFSRINHKAIQLEILNSGHRQLAVIKRSPIELLDNGWESFTFAAVKLQKGKSYLLRLSSAESVSGDAVTWWASEKPSYANGSAIVDGVPQYSDFAFRLKFEGAITTDQ